MQTLLQILHLEDDPADTELMLEVLRADGIDCEVVRVDSKLEFLESLRDQRFDIVVSDVSVPGFDGIAAQQIWQESGSTIPFIFLSGTFGEDVAIERLKEGATDYVLKNWMEKLPGVVRRALREATERSGRQQAQAALEKLNAELENRVRERTLQLGAANQALAESERRLFDILDHSPASIFMKDLRGKYVFVNRRCEEVMARHRTQVIGKTDYELLPPRLADIYRTNDMQVMQSGSPHVFEEIGYEENRKPRILHSSKFMLRDRAGKAYALCGMSTDITERKYAEEEMNIARREAERANRAKSEFLSRMSHDLRTPLNAVLGFAQLLDMDELTTDQRESVVQILEAGRHLLDLMNEVLDISRIESGHLSLSPEPVAVREIVDQVVKLVRPLGAQQQIEVEALASATRDHHVRADRQRLNQILLNLLSNAIKYNRRGGRVRVSCEENENGKLRVNVTDTGAGIPPEKLALLFKPFERLGAEQSGIEGTGLGLALSRGLVEAMGGKLGVDSEIDRGSTFWVELHRTHPAAGNGASPQSSPVTAAPELVAGRVLYIEDNTSNVRLVERLLKQRRPGITLLTAVDGERGIAMAQKDRPHLILLDLHLPDMSGEEVLRRLWEEQSTREIPITILSADATLVQTRRLLAAGAKGYLTKPLEVSRLLALLDESLV